MSDTKPNYQFQFDLKTLVFLLVLASVVTALVVSRFQSNNRIKELDQQVQELNRDKAVTGAFLNQMAELQMELEVLKSNYGPSHPAIQAKREQVDIILRYMNDDSFKFNGQKLPGR